MITITNYKIQNIPVLEVVKEEDKDKNLPVIFFYHGWTGCKESVLVHGHQLAEEGFRAILPDAMHHGERKLSMNLLESAEKFWPIIFNSLDELPVMKGYYESKYGGNQRIGVSGLSMGGMTSAALMTVYPWIEAVSVLMGSVDPVGFTKWLLQSKAVSEVTESIQLLNALELSGLYEKLDEISLKKHPEHIAGRPLHFWHATSDMVVPFSPTYEFYEESKQKEFAENISFDVTEGGGHSVPFVNIQNNAAFFRRVIR